MALKRKAAFVDLSTGEVEIKEIPQQLRELYLGGRGIDMYLLYNLLEPGIDPLGPDNVFIVSAGPLTGTPAPCPSRCHMAGKSPLTGLVGCSNMGGFFGPELRFAGFDHVIVHGKAAQPVYLWIKNGAIEVRDATHLWGVDATESQVSIRKELGDREIKSLTIGAAGENLVRFACVRSGMKNAAGRTGMGAVMGSKNLKAIAARGTMPIEISNPEAALKDLNELIEGSKSSKYVEVFTRFGTLFLFDSINSTGIMRTRNFQFNQLVDSEEVEAEGSEEFSTGMAACFGCHLHCRHKYTLDKGPWKGQFAEGPEFASTAALTALVGSNKIQGALEGNHLANTLGLDTIETGSMIAWAIELNEKGLLPQELIGNLQLEWGNTQTVNQLIQDIAHRRGLGDILAEGPKRAIKRLGPETAYYNIQVKGMSCNVSDERPVPSLALGIATATRGADHLRSRCALDLYHLPEEVLEMVYRREGMSSDFRDYKGKAWMVFFTENNKSTMDCLGICQFSGAGLSPNLAAPEDFARIIENITGIKLTYNQFMEIGERITNIERLFNIREGASRQDDYLPDRYYDEPTALGPESTRGLRIERNKFDEILDEYYEFHRWDKDGNPTSKTLKRLSLDQEPSYLLCPSEILNGRYKKTG